MPRPELVAAHFCFGRSSLDQSLDVGFLIDWSKEAKITPLATVSLEVDHWTVRHPKLRRWECSGFVGLSRFFSSSYLFVITSSKLWVTTSTIHALSTAARCASHSTASGGSHTAIRSQAAKHNNVEPAETPVESDSDGETDYSESDYDDVQRSRHPQGAILLVSFQPAAI